MHKLLLSLALFTSQLIALGTSPKALAHSDPSNTVRIMDNDTLILMNVIELRLVGFQLSPSGTLSACSAGLNHLMGP